MIGYAFQKSSKVEFAEKPNETFVSSTGLVKISLSVYEKLYRIK